MIYFISDGRSFHSFTKVGYTENSAYSRLASFQTGNAHKLIVLWEMPGGPEMEQMLHRYFKACHYRGEWFRTNECFLDLYHIMSNTACAIMAKEADESVCILKIANWLETACSWSTSWDKMVDMKKERLNDPEWNVPHLEWDITKEII